jgi:hypothetical protein
VARIHGLSRIGRAAASLAVLFVAWLVWTSTLAADECIAGALAAAIGTIGAAVARRSDVGRLELRAKWLAPMRWWLLDVPADTWRLLRAVAHRETRSLEASSEGSLPFEPGGDDPASVMRRALALTITSVAPNTIAIDVDRDRRRFVYHQVVRRPIPAPARELSHSS